ncbi:hypothetical protein BaRGS_00011888 [Batillaria attramentaria]|uniref:Uncharacterized protein n=1 Tax=Batillaria attramentaria TaxID=370345 RepID=A0ABD0LCD2_9CAEN
MVHISSLIVYIRKRNTPCPLSPTLCQSLSQSLSVTQALYTGEWWSLPGFGLAERGLQMYDKSIPTNVMFPSIPAFDTASTWELILPRYIA